MEVPVLGGMHERTDPRGTRGARRYGDSQGGVSMNARAPHVVLPKPFLKRLEGAGIYCQTWVTAERQARTGRWVLRAVESGGASKDIGRYIGFFAMSGDRLPWLQRLDRVTASGVRLGRSDGVPEVSAARQ